MTLITWHSIWSRATYIRIQRRWPRHNGVLEWLVIELIQKNKASLVGEGRLIDGARTVPWGRHFDRTVQLRPKPDWSYKTVKLHMKSWNSEIIYCTYNPSDRYTIAPRAGAKCTETDMTSSHKCLYFMGARVKCVHALLFGQQDPQDRKSQTRSAGRKEMKPSNTFL